MWNKTADITIRAVLLVSVASVGVTPATASVLPVTRVIEPAGAGYLPDAARIILAQTVDHPGKDGGRDRDKPTNDGRGTERELPLNRVTTRDIVLDLASIRRECSNYDEVYRIDCLRQGIEMIVASLPENSEYRDAKRILKQASKRLAVIVTTYEDPAAPKLDVPASANPRFNKNRKLTAVRREALPEAMARAQNAVDEAKTALLRSSENSERRYAHYQEISIAVDSTKVLLRSS